MCAGVCLILNFFLFVITMRQVYKMGSTPLRRGHKNKKGVSRFVTTIVELSRS